MRATDLDFRDLFDFSPEAGILKFGHQRCILLDAVALGLLRRQLIANLGVEVARGLLTRFGYAHGWRTAESLSKTFPWDDPAEWRRAGGRFHELQGLVTVESCPNQGVGGNPFAEAHWHNSYEAEQHLLHLGQSEQPVCWTLVGFASGYLSHCNKREIIVREVSCVGRGDAYCKIEGRPREEWGDDVLQDLPYYQKDFLESTLNSLTKQLKKTEEDLRKRQAVLKQSETESLEVSGLVARSAKMCELLKLAKRAAKVDTNVLITGESGVGKERMARLIHDNSPRANGPFLAVNCGAISESLIESELFGHSRGSFTGADRNRVGLFESAQGGTLFLDEIGELPLGTQVKLLRVLQEREVRRVGENETRKINVRVVAATNRDLKDEVEAGRFRGDLYYRLRVIELAIPPLRERKEDILPIARTALVELCERIGRPMNGFTPQAADQLLKYSWPGNVRELQNAVEHAIVVAESNRLDIADFPMDVRSESAAIPFFPGDPRKLEDVERDYILQVLKDQNWHRGKAAEILGIGTATLYRKLKAYRKAGFDIKD